MNEALVAKHKSPRPGPAILSLLIGAWLIVVQPGMSYYWLINPCLHAEIDADVYGQSPTGETLPGHSPHAPHDHSPNVGGTLPDFTVTNPFDETFYASLLSAAQQPALQRQFEIAVIARSITIEPPDQPPRA